MATRHHRNVMTINGGEQFCMLKSFPLLIPQNTERTRYKGFLSVEDEDFFISLYVPRHPSPKGLSIQCSWELSVLLSDHKKELEEWRERQSSLYTYLECLQNLIVFCLQNDKGRQILKHDSHLSVKTLKGVAQELESIGANNVKYISSTCRNIMIQEVDAASRTHHLSFKLGSSYPTLPPLIEADLPAAAMKTLNKKSSLSAIHKVFVQQINALQEFWNALDDIDEQCWVMDPEHPTRKDIHRRIVIGNNVSVHITLDPSNAKELPDVKFLGSERGILSFQLAFAGNMKLWSSEKGLIENIKAILEISEFPSAPTGAEQSDELVHQGECAICVTMQLNGEIPSKSCENEKCGAIYHISCLHEWLQTIPTSKKAFNYILGECPNCFSAISYQRPS